MDKHVDIVVAGHTCIDLIPALPEGRNELTDMLVPGHMLHTGPMVLSTGGAVPNTGLALHRLGVPVRLVGKVGQDALGRAVQDNLAAYDPVLTAYVQTAAGESSGYTVIISAPGLDRIFLHYPGPNDSFGADDVPLDALQGAKIFHFGYPSLMRRMFEDDGRELARLLRKVKQAGLITALDVSLPDAESDAGNVDWHRLLERVLPLTDVFLPNLDEALFMLQRERYLDEFSGIEDLPSKIDSQMLSDLAQSLVAMGAAVAGIKLGDQGMLLRTCSDKSRWQSLAGILPLDPRQWANREILSPAFHANLVGTTGAGDCTNAGLLTGMLKGLLPERALTMAVAVGSCNVEAADAVSGIPAWEQVIARVDAGWDYLHTRLRLRGWGWESAPGLWFGPADRGGLWA